jgi:hypothetical protein
MVAWLVNWIMVTRPRSIGTVTANTFTQLETKTWAAIQRWSKLSIFADWFECNANLFYAKDDKAHGSALRRVQRKRTASLRRPAQQGRDQLLLLR